METLVPWSVEWKERELEKLKDKWSGCKACVDLVGSRRSIVFGQGNPDADIFILGEAPGEEEDKYGEPFVGPSGDFIDAILENAKISKRLFWFDNIVACHPEDNRGTTTDEKNSCRQRILDTIYIIDPMLIICLGKAAAQAMIGSRSKSIEKMFGKFTKMTIPGKELELEYDAMVLYHPSFILRTESPDDNGVFPYGSIANKEFDFFMDAITAVDTLKEAYYQFEKENL